MLFFKSGLHFLNLKFGFPNNFLVQLGQGFNSWWVRHGHSEWLISTEAQEPPNRPEDRLGEELQYPWAVAQTAEAAVLQVFVRGHGLIKEDITMKIV